MNLPTIRGWAAVCLVAALTVGCAGGDQEGESLQEAVGAVTAGYQVLDLESGAIQARDSIPELQSDPQYRSSKMVFRRIADAGGSQRVYIGVFEVTQAQWQLLAQTAPWQDVPSSAMLGGEAAVAPDRPACNLSYQSVTGALAGFVARHGVALRLPSDDEWTTACAAAEGPYPWGSATGEAAVAKHAVTWETSAGRGGARRVGTRAANRHDLHDMAGNVWEFTAAGVLRGGSWVNDLPQARVANRLELPPDRSYPAAGVRLVLRP